MNRGQGFRQCYGGVLALLVDFPYIERYTEGIKSKAGERTMNYLRSVRGKITVIGITMLIIILVVLVPGLNKDKEKPAAQPQSQASSSATEIQQEKAPMIQIGEATLKWEKPDGFYMIIEKIAYDDGFLLLYEVENQQTEDKRIIPMVQLFDKQGTYQTTMPIPIERPYHCGKDKYKEIELVDETLLFALADDYYKQYTVFNLQTGNSEEYVYTRSVTDGSATLLANQQYSEEKNNNLLTVTLVEEGAKLTSIECPHTDSTFQWAFEGGDGTTGVPTHEVKITLDAAKRTAVVTNTKLTYTFDFNTATYRLKRYYSPEILGEAIAKSPDGTYEIFAADSMGAGDVFWFDLVVHNTTDNSYRFIGERYTGEIIFIDNQFLLVNDINKLEVYDCSTGKLADHQIQFDHIRGDGTSYPKYFTIGMANDTENQLILLLYRETEPESESNLEISKPIQLGVYGYDGKLVKTIDTGYRHELWHNNNVWTLKPVVNGNGTVTILDERRLWEAQSGTIEKGNEPERKVIRYM